MTREELANLERLVNYMAYSFMKKSRWQDISKLEWQDITGLLLKAKDRKRKTAKPFTIGANYIYEHLIIRKLYAVQNGQPVATAATPNHTKLNGIAVALGYEGYIDFINNAHETHPFNELRINIPNKKEKVNTALLDNLVGHWYCYNRNLPYEPGKRKEERIWRSALEIFKEGDEYLVERTGKGAHNYYGKIVAYDDYVFIIMNSTMLTRQRHFIARIKDVGHKLAQKNYKIGRINFVSTCVSFNDEPIALYEIFDRVTNLKKLEKQSIDLPIDSPAIPENILLHLRDIERNRITQH